MRDEVAGDPMSGLRWTRKTTEKIAEQLTCLGIEVSPNTVARLLSEMGFSLKTNRKNIESGVKHQRGHSARRNQQFLTIKRTRHRFENADQPIISVDGKKREIIGNFKNNGRGWRRKPKQVNDHDFRTDAIGVALPYGIYDVQRNTGMVVVGTTRETPAFAVDAIDRWWRTRGRKDYPGAERLLILADSGGANSARSRVWKCDLQQKICNRYGLIVTVHHYPPGASKWNPIEHKLFSEISRNWQGVPLETYETAIKYISATQTRTGLKVSAILNSKNYDTGETVTDEEIQMLHIRPHRTLPEWNYTIKPQV
ncbi:MAG: ISAzo13 family transposase [Acidiferrobacterales bacterium]